MFDDVNAIEYFAPNGRRYRISNGVLYRLLRPDMAAERVGALDDLVELPQPLGPTILPAPVYEPEPIVEFTFKGPRSDFARMARPLIRCEERRKPT